MCMVMTPSWEHYDIVSVIEGAMAGFPEALDELKRRAQQGDPHAQSALRSLDSQDS